MAAPSGSRRVRTQTARCLSLLLAGAACPAAHASDSAPAAAEFDPAFLRGSGGMNVDISRFAKGNPVLPGDYPVDFVVNARFVDRIGVRFVAAPGSETARPCFDRALLGRAGLSFPALDKALRQRIAALPAQACIDLSEISPEIAVRFDQARLELALDLPQALVTRQPRGYVAPEFWETGVHSATLRYDLSFFHADTSSSVANSAYLRIDAGANVGSWHLRHRFSLTLDEDGSDYDGVATFLEHDIPSLQSRLVLGDAFTDGTVFDSIGYRGVGIGTDDRMRPDSLSGYAPTVRGIARTTARVRISQNGVLLLETTVPPGPFEINDLFPTGYGGDLDVAILEADGSQQSFKVPFAALPQMLRPGMLRYELVGGEFRDGDIATGERFVQASLQYGLTDGLTGYVGGQAAGGYGAALVGLSWNSPVGAIAMDATWARTRMGAGAIADGYSLRASLAKTLAPTRTTLSLAGYRYSSGGFWSLQDALRLRAGRAANLRARERMQLTFNQTLPRRWGNLYLSGSSTRYWNSPGSVIQLQAGYNNTAPLLDSNINYGLAYSRQRDRRSGDTDNRLLLSLSVGLGNKPDSPQVSASIARVETNGEDALNGQLSVTGTVGRVPRLSYSLVATATPDHDALSVGLGYRGKRATLAATASAGTGFRQASFGMSGGLVVHPGGWTLTNQLEDTVAIVSAPGARGARVESGTGIALDGAGNAVIPFIRPYRVNDVSINPEGLPPDIELQSTSQQVAPRANAVVLVRFATTRGRAVAFTLALPDGRPVPFGASVRDASGAEVAMAGEYGVVFLRLPDRSGRLTARWGDGPASACGFAYALPESTAPVLESTQTCQPVLAENAP